MTVRTYLDYKVAGSGWLSLVPTHWTVVPNKAILEERKVLVGAKSSNFTLLSLTVSGVKVRDISSGKGKFPAEFDSYKVVEADDLVFCLFDIDETPRTVGLAMQNGMITGAYDIFKCSERADASFLYYFYLFVDLHKGLRPWYTGLRKVVRPDTFMSIKLALPPLAEQIAIRRFLDVETFAIDELINEQLRLIELIKEKRRATISHVITNGLDSKTAMTKFDGPGQNVMPKHWSVVPNSQLLRRSDAPVGKKESSHLLLSLSIKGVVARDMESGKGKFPANFETYQIVKQDQLIFCLFDIDETPRTVGIAEIAGMVTGAYDVFDCIGQCLPRFLYYRYLHLDFGKALRPYYTGLRKVIRPQTFSSIKMALPPLDEQEDIVRYLDAEMKHFDDLIETCNKGVALLQERRIALIAATVIGKIDVRNGTPKEAE